MEQAVLPHEAALRDAKRLDGQPSGGYWDVLGVFVHDGSAWAVHADTHFATPHYEYLRHVFSNRSPTPSVRLSHQGSEPSDWPRAYAGGLGLKQREQRRQPGKRWLIQRGPVAAQRQGS